MTEASALLIGAGAGMGVDSGLPDFRGTQGFWRGYLPFAKLGLDFFDMANPRWFGSDPEFAWGFYGHRLNLYRATEPHSGFSILKRWGEQMANGFFVFTSNVDGQSQKAGFDEDCVVECHGSIHHLQCASPCGSDIWSADSIEVGVDENTFRARQPLPLCPRCGDAARPNVLMFEDSGWLGERSLDQDERFGAWQQHALQDKLVVVELGAGTAVPSVRWQCERAADWPGTTLIRINPGEAQGPADVISISRGALEALQVIDAKVRRLADSSAG